MQDTSSDAQRSIALGGDTVAVGIAATMYYLLRHDDVYKKLQQEVRSTFRSRQSVQTGSLLDACAYLRACVNESLRLSPPGPGIFWRQCDNDMEVDGVFLPAGTEFGVSIYALHHNPDVFRDPETFRPDRFLFAKGSPGFIPFLSGFRACPAQRLAYCMMSLPIARLVWEFDMQIVRPTLSSDGAEGNYEQKDAFGSKVSGPMVRFRSIRT